MSEPLNTLIAEVEPYQGATTDPIELALEPPKVTKVEGPYNEKDELLEYAELGVTYYYYATLNINASAINPKQVQWAIGYDSENFEKQYYIKSGEKIKNNKVKIYINVGDIENTGEKIEDQFRIYSYIGDTPDTNVFAEVALLEDDYVKAIRDKKIVYTCNCGWIDKTHAFTDTKRTEYYIGAKNLWSQILNESGLTSNSPNEQGFQVVYRQDATIIQNVPIINEPFRLGTTKSYFVKNGLSIREKEQVALAIFQEVSIDFEEFQSFGAVIGKGDSSFEPADLVSNLISFYRIVRPELTEGKILSLSCELTPEQSVKVYRKYPGTFSDEKYKNRVFKPRYFPSKFCDGKPNFPKELQTITPAKKGNLFRDWMPIFDVYGGKPPITGSK